MSKLQRRPTGWTCFLEVGGKDRGIGTPDAGVGWGPGPPAGATHRRLKVEPRKEGFRDSATVATV